MTDHNRSAASRNAFVTALRPLFLILTLTSIFVAYHSAQSAASFTSWRSLPCEPPITDRLPSEVTNSPLVFDRILTSGNAYFATQNTKRADGYEIDTSVLFAASSDQVLAKLTNLSPAPRMELSRNDQFLIADVSGAAVAVIDLRSGQTRHTFDWTDGRVQFSINFATDQAVIRSNSHAIVLDLLTGNVVRSHHISRIEPSFSYLDRKGRLKCVRVDVNEESDCVEFWDELSHQKTFELVSQEDVYGIQFSLDYSLIAIFTDSGIQIRSLEDGGLKSTLPNELQERPGSDRYGSAWLPRPANLVFSSDLRWVATQCLLKDPATVAARRFLDAHTADRIEAARPGTLGISVTDLETNRTVFRAAGGFDFSFIAGTNRLVTFDEHGKRAYSSSAITARPQIQFIVWLVLCASILLGFLGIKNARRMLTHR